jgi:ubiquinone/menaquinone biosynthesis C-methylase UbiE
VKATGGGSDIHGVDTSAEMVRMATFRNARSVELGRMSLLRANARSIPYPDGYFDRVLSVHTLYFWREPVLILREALRVLKPGARLVIGFRYDADSIRSFPASVYTFRPPEEVSELLRAAGFVFVRSLSRTFGRCQLHFSIAQRRLQ